MALETVLCHTVYYFEQRALHANIHYKKSLAWFNASGFEHTIKFGPSNFEDCLGYPQWFHGRLASGPRINSIKQWTLFPQNWLLYAPTAYRWSRCWCGLTQSIWFWVGMEDEPHSLALYCSTSPLACPLPAAVAGELTLNQHILNMYVFGSKLWGFISESFWWWHRLFFIQWVLNNFTILGT